METTKKLKTGQKKGRKGGVLPHARLASVRAAIMPRSPQNDPLLSELIRGLEKVRTKRGAFIAAPSHDYNACWMRDQLYANFAYFYTGDREKFSEGLRVVFDILYKSRAKIERAVCHPPRYTHDFIHAKFHPHELSEITNDWGHHQLDAIGLFLYMVALAERHGIRILTNTDDRNLIQLLVFYLNSVRYFELPDNGMWEEGVDLHTSSIGAVAQGLIDIQKQGLALVPDALIRVGIERLYEILPNESPCRPVDMAQLSLIWPYRVVPDEIADIILRRVTDMLVQSNGLNRYLDDNYYRSDNGISAEWPMGFFWLSIIYAERDDMNAARAWFSRGMQTATEHGHLPELFQNGLPNGNTPLSWTHSLATIALTKLSWK